MDSKLEQLKKLIDERVNEKIDSMKVTDSFVSSGDLSGYNVPKSLGNGIIQTREGSVIDTKNTSTPWIYVSDDLKQFCKSFFQYVRTNVADDYLQEKWLGTTTDTAGGFLVPEEFANQMVVYTAPGNIVWPRATKWTMTTDKLQFPKLGQVPESGSSQDHFAGVSFEWIDEGDSKPETEPNFTFLELTVHELAGYTEISDNLIDEAAINIMNFLTQLYRLSYMYTTDTAFISGTGAGQPLGVISDPQVTLVNRNTAGTVVFTDLVNMDNALPSMFEQGAVWFMNKAILNALRNERDSNNAPILQEVWGYDAGIGTTSRITTIFGYPVIRSDGKTSSKGTKGDVILGNWSYYYIGECKKYNLDVSKHAAFRRNKTAIRCSGKLDGQASIPEAFVVLTDYSSSS
ncbi:MAG: phage major capsid protein [Candidatus Heimdallarchaeaceae archaeon]